jgi:hypothetical protein
MPERSKSRYPARGPSGDDGARRPAFTLAARRNHYSSRPVVDAEVSTNVA